MWLNGRRSLNDTWVADFGQCSVIFALCLFIKTYIFQKILPPSSLAHATKSYILQFQLNTCIILCICICPGPILIAAAGNENIMTSTKTCREHGNNTWKVSKTALFWMDALAVWWLSLPSTPIYLRCSVSNCRPITCYRRGEAWQSSWGNGRLRRRWSGPVTLLIMNTWEEGLQSVSSSSLSADSEILSMQWLPFIAALKCFHK